MQKILGLDLGTNSIGWAVVEQLEEGGYRPLYQGVDIFQEGVTIEKGSERPTVQDRTDARALRRHYFRRRLRKIETLKALIRFGLCPALTDEQLSEWRKHKHYPMDEEFLHWQRTDDNMDKNPYHDRYRALTERLNLDHQADRYTLGRALYHLAQRRGFISNRKDVGNESEDGQVKSSIKGLSDAMAQAGCSYLGEYFYQLYQKGEHIRNRLTVADRYTSRNEHYLAEFRAICEQQQLPEEWRKALHRAIFFQRDLKSQKGSVGRCTFEKSKSRCPVSHPRFEEFRMWQFINNIRITTPAKPEPHPLSQEEIDEISPLFFRKSKPHFDFEEIAKKIAGKGQYACKGDRCHAAYTFNYSRTTTVSGCPVTAALRGIFGEDWQDNICSLYTLSAGKDEKQMVNDVWHALFSFNDDDSLRTWAITKLQLSDEQADEFIKIHLPQGYAALSLNAIDKILPYLHLGNRYDEAVFLANLKAVLPQEYTTNAQKIAEVEKNVLKLLRKEQSINDYLRDFCGVDNSHLDRLYHPSMIETYPVAKPDAEGRLLLGSPRTSSVRNPMAMRTLFRMRALINALLKDGRIDHTTKINIEFSRELNDANRRHAIQQYQRERENEHARYREEIRTQYATETGMEIEPTEEDILKYRLWDEQKHICPYTGRSLGITDFIGTSTTVDIEHTVPRARGGDNSQMNKTLCDNHFNRAIKINKLPAELANHAEILARIETFGWQEKIDALEKQISGQLRRSKAAATKSEKDAAIQRRHYLQMQLDYWRGKIERFRMEDVPEGFSNRQGVDIGIIGRYARLYLKTVFDRIYTVKGATTAEFRKMWGLQEEHTKKERVNHVHHCIDAITIACIGRREYILWAQYTANQERYLKGHDNKPIVEKPWPTFTEDVHNITEKLLVSHYTADNMPKQSRKRLRVRGQVRLNDQGEPMMMQGDTARGALHMQTFYGAIQRDDEIKYVVRKSLSSLEPGDVEKIVDDVVKEKVKSAIDTVGFKKAIDPSQHTIWMNEEKQIPIRKVRIFAHVTNPIHLKPHRDLSAKEYKQSYHVDISRNYGMAVYERCNAKGIAKRSFYMINYFNAAQYFKKSNDKSLSELIPLSNAKDYDAPLKYILKSGTMVLFYEKTPEELYDCTQNDLCKRLYKVKSLEKDGRAQFVHHQIALSSKELSAKFGKGEKTFQLNPTSPLLRLSASNFNMYVEGVDFELTVTGEIKFKH